VQGKIIEKSFHLLDFPGGVCP